MTNLLPIVVDGVEYNLNVASALAANVLTPVKHYGIGDRFRKFGADEYIFEYILAHVAEDKIALINVRYGTRWCDSVTVNNVNNITSEEFYAVTGTEPYNFTKIE